MAFFRRLSSQIELNIFIKFTFSIELNKTLNFSRKQMVFINFALVFGVCVSFPSVLAEVKDQNCALKSTAKDQCVCYYHSFKENICTDASTYFICQVTQKHIPKLCSDSLRMCDLSRDMCRNVEREALDIHKDSHRGIDINFIKGKLSDFCTFRNKFCWNVRRSLCDKFMEKLIHRCDSVLCSVLELPFL